MARDQVEAYRDQLPLDSYGRGDFSKGTTLPLSQSFLSPVLKEVFELSA